VASPMRRLGTKPSCSRNAGGLHPFFFRYSLCEYTHCEYHARCQGHSTLVKHHLPSLHLSSRAPMPPLAASGCGADGSSSSWIMHGGGEHPA
jgi:hypothetical protein